MKARLAARLRERAPEAEPFADVVWGRSAWSVVFEDERLLWGLDLRRQI